MTADDRPHRRPRKLSDEERVLWTTVAKSIAPLRRKIVAVAEPEPVAPAAVPPKARAKIKPAPPAATAPAPKPSTPPEAAPLGRRDKRRIARTDAIDGRLDLHGLTQAQAHDALLRFLHNGQARGARLVLIITGKGGGDAYSERGVLKRQVPMWLRLPEFRTCVIGFEQAGIGHGGEGALYVRLRKGRED
jgi:DNA-nicking Smr family endonuclease